jgi:hypothetical protein
MSPHARDINWTHFDRERQVFDARKTMELITQVRLENAFKAHEMLLT